MTFYLFLPCLAQRPRLELNGDDEQDLQLLPYTTTEIASAIIYSSQNPAISALTRVLIPPTLVLTCSCLHPPNPICTEAQHATQAWLFLQHTTVAIALLHEQPLLTTPQCYHPLHSDSAPSSLSIPTRRMLMMILSNLLTSLPRWHTISTPSLPQSLNRLLRMTRRAPSSCRPPQL